MKQEDIQKALEALGKSGITVAGDLVLEKHVEHEVNNVEAGGIGIQIVNGKVEEAAKDYNNEEGELSNEKLARAIEDTQEYFWGNSAYAVVFCVCRDDFGMQPNKSAFERMVELLPYKSVTSYRCSTGTIANAFANNSLIYSEKVDKWEGEKDAQNERIDELEAENRKLRSIIRELAPDSMPSRRGENGRSQARNPDGTFAKKEEQADGE